jgi:hypothetical protein
MKQDTNRLLSVLALLLLSIIPASSRALADGCMGNDQWINTSRPIQTTATAVIPEGSLQVENGANWNVGQRSNTLDGPETFIRYGLFHCTDLQLVMPDYFATVKGPAPSGFSDSALSFEYQFGALPDRYQLSIVAALDVPSGDKNIEGYGWDPYLQFPWQVALTDQWTTSGMFSFTWYTNHPNDGPTFEPTYSLERSFGGPHGTAAIEYAGIYDHQQPTQLLDGYLQWRFNKYQQVDVESGFGLNRSSPDHFFGFGYSFRFDNLLNRLAAAG